MHNLNAALKIRNTHDEKSPQNELRSALIEKATKILLEIVKVDDCEKFRLEEDSLAQGLAEIGLESTRKLLQRYVEPQPDEILINGKRYKKVVEISGCRVCTPFGTLTVPRGLYREEGQRGVKGVNTVGLLELRAGIIEGATPRMAEIITYYDAAVPSREAEKLMDLAGLHGPRRATLEKKAGIIGNKLASNIDQLLEITRSKQPLPDGAAMITIGMDRVNVPYEELNPTGEKSERTRQLREKKPYQRQEPDPIIRLFHGDFVGNVSIRNKYGELIGGYAYGLSHTEDPRYLADWLVADVVAAIEQCPKILVSVCQDGARELWPITWEALARRQELADVHISSCIDFHHFSPRVYNMVELLWSKNAYSKWEDQLLNKPKAVIALADAVLRKLEKLGNKATSEQIDAVHNFITYIEERTRVDGREDRRSELFDYASLRASGLPIGSGPTEATAKSVVSVRMKRCGNRWSIPGAIATLTCRAITLSLGRWEIVWPQFADSHVSNVAPLY